jgi:glyoxylase-like metal-dependent hydrolase (beta-lactamase superfamily II)
MPPAATTSVATGIHRLPLPTPLPVGDVNAYLIEDDPLVLVDCGPDTGTALGALEEHLGELGYALGDLGLLVVTHPHADHFGLAAEIVRRTGVTVACLDAVAPVLEGWEAWVAQEDETLAAGLVRHGVPAEVAVAAGTYGSPSSLGRPTRVDRRLAAGSVLQLRDRAFTVLHRPGHSPGDTVLHDPEARVLIAGDHLLADISSNAVVARPLGEWDGRRPTPLLDYRASLLQTRALDLDVCRGGHGGPVIDHRALIDERFALHEKRAAKLSALLDEPRSAHELARRLWGADVAVAQTYATVSEVLGHLDLLIERGEVHEDRDAELIVFVRRA